LIDLAYSLALNIKSATNGGDRRIFWVNVVDRVVLPVVVTAFVVWLLSRHAYQSAVGTVVLVIVGRFFTTLREQSRTIRSIWVVFSASAVLIVAFATGYERADKILDQKLPVEIISVEGEDVPGRIVRGGDRGVLFFAVGQQQLKFLRWDVIKKIETAKQ
jgi:hypothetical protein